MFARLVRLNARRGAAVVCCISMIVLAACSAGGSIPPSTPASTGPASSATAQVPGSPPAIAPTGSVTPTATPGPATAGFTLAGGAGLSGAVANLTIRCATPSLAGMTIDMFGSAADPSVSLRITLTLGQVAVTESSGSGGTYSGRSFSGSGVAAFSPATGATVDSTLSEVASPGIAPGTLGALTTIRGTVACGNQAAGRSTLVFTGDGPEGRLAGGVDPVSVECIPYAAGDRVSVIGLAKAGSTPALMVISLAADSLSVAEWPNGSPTPRFYNTIKPGSVSLVAGGAHVNGDATEPYATTGALAIHVEGDVTCGWTASP